jgi:hypothetical protein
MMNLNIHNGIRITLGVICLEALVLAYDAVLRPNMELDGFYNIYTQAVSKFEQDNYIENSNENDRGILNQILFEKHNACFRYDGLPVYPNGEEAPFDSVKSWIDAYLKESRPKK